MHSFHQVTCEMLEDFGYGQVRKIFPYNKFRLAWYAFIDLLDIDMNNGFCCPVCSTTPDLVICDGTSLAFQKRMWTWQENERVNDGLIDVQTRLD